MDEMEAGIEEKQAVAASLQDLIYLSGRRTLPLTLLTGIARRAYFAT